MLAFLPSLIFFLIAPVSVSLAIWLAFGAVFAVAIRTFIPTGSLRVFDASGLTLFGALALYDAVLQPGSTPADISLVVEAGLFATALWSITVGQPFTAPYRLFRRRHEPAQLARVHRLLASLWAVCFALMAAVDAGTAILHRLSSVWASGLGLVFFAAALTFTWQFALYIDKHPEDIPLLGKR